MNQNLVAVIMAAAFFALLLVGRSCGENSSERELARWRECVQVCGGSALLDGTRCLCVKGVP